MDIDASKDSIELVARLQNLSRCIAEVSPQAAAVYQNAHQYFTETAKQVLGIQAEYLRQPVKITEELERQLAERVYLPVKLEAITGLNPTVFYLQKIELLRGLVNTQIALIDGTISHQAITQLPLVLYPHAHPNARAVLSVHCTEASRDHTFENLAEIVGGHLSLPIHRDTWSAGHGVYVCSDKFAYNQLLQELSNPLQHVNIVIINNFEVRSVEGDLFLGLMKRLVLPKRRDMRLIVCGSGYDTYAVAKVLGDLALVQLPKELPLVKERYLTEYTHYFEATLDVTERVAAGKILKKQWGQVVLVFVATSGEALTLKKVLGDRLGPLKVHCSVKILEDQGKLGFVSSNEIMLLITTSQPHQKELPENIDVVIDCCRVSSKNKSTLTPKMSSEATTARRQALLKTGGTVYKVLTKEEMLKLEKYDQPSILQRNCLKYLVQLLKAGVYHLSLLPLPHLPEKKALYNMYSSLAECGAISPVQGGLGVTELGLFLSTLSLPVRSSVAVYHAISSGLGMEVYAMLLFANHATFIFDPRKDYKVDVKYNSPVFQSNYLVDERLVRLGELIQLLFIYRQYTYVQCKNCLAAKQKNPRCLMCPKTKTLWANAYHVEATSLVKTYRKIVGGTSVPASQLQIDGEADLANMAALVCLMDSPQSVFNRNYAEAESLFGEVLAGYADLAERLAPILTVSFSKHLAVRLSDTSMSNGFKELRTNKIVHPHLSSPYFRKFGEYPPEYIYYYKTLNSTKSFFKFCMPVTQLEPTIIQQCQAASNPLQTEEIRANDTNPSNEVVQCHHRKYQILILGPGGVPALHVNVKKEPILISIIGLPPRLHETFSCLRNLFPTQTLAIQALQNCFNILVYLEADGNLNEIARHLQETPILGQSGVITQCRVIKKARCNYLLRVSLPQEVSKDKLDALLFGPVQQRDIQSKRDRPVQIALRYYLREHAQSMIRGFRQAAREEFGDLVKTDLTVLKKIFQIPKRFPETLVQRLKPALYQAAKDSKVKLSIFDRNKVYVQWNRNIDLDRILFIMQPIVLEVPHTIYRRMCENPPQNDRVWIDYSYMRNILNIYGLPEDREEHKNRLGLLVSACRAGWTTDTATFPTSGKYLAAYSNLYSLFNEESIEYTCSATTKEITLTGVISARAKSILQSDNRFNPMQFASCPLCAREDLELYQLIACGHTIHHNCLITQLLTQLHQHSASPFPLACLRCSSPIAYTDLLSQLEICELVHQAAAVEYVRQKPGLTLCPAVTCGAIIEVSGQIYSCKACKGKFCKQCGQSTLDPSHETKCSNAVLPPPVQEITVTCRRCRYVFPQREPCCPRCKTSH